LYHITYKKAVSLILLHPLFSKIYIVLEFFFFRTHTNIIHSIHSSNSSSNATTEQKKSVYVYRRVLWMFQGEWKCSVTKPSLWWYFSLCHSYHLFWLDAPTTLKKRPPLNFYPIHIQKFFFYNPPPSFISFSSFLWIFCCCCHCHPYTSYQPFNQRTKPSYLQMLFVYME
jgi:hypothetical protein